MSKLGTKLFLTRRMEIVPDTIRGNKQLPTMRDAVEGHKTEVAA